MVYLTNFSAVETTLREGAIWKDGKADGLDWNDVKSNSGIAFASTLCGIPSRYNDSIAHLIQPFHADQYAQATVFRSKEYSAKHEVELLLRFEINEHFARGYEILWGATGYLAIVRWNGPLGDYTALFETGDPGIGSAVEGDRLRAEIKGTLIRVYKNDRLVASADTATSGGAVWSEGRPGIGFWPVDGANVQKYGWKQFLAGNL